MFLITHGDDWDRFNCTDDFSFGYSITKIVIMYEAIGEVEGLKDFDETFFDRDEYIKKFRNYRCD